MIQNDLPFFYEFRKIRYLNIWQSLLFFVTLQGNTDIVCARKSNTI